MGSGLLARIGPGPAPSRLTPPERARAASSLRTRRRRCADTVARRPVAWLPPVLMPPIPTFAGNAGALASAAADRGRAVDAGLSANVEASGVVGVALEEPGPPSWAAAWRRRRRMRSSALMAAVASINARPLSSPAAAPPPPAPTPPASLASPSANAGATAAVAAAEAMAPGELPALDAAEAAAGAPHDDGWSVTRTGGPGGGPAEAGGATTMVRCTCCTWVGARVAAVRGGGGSCGGHGSGMEASGALRMSSEAIAVHSTSHGRAAS